MFNHPVSFLKNFTSKLHKRINGKKMTLSQLRTEVACCFGKSDIKEISEDYNLTQGHLEYISHIDDPRVTFEMAKEFYNIQKEEFEEFEDEFLEEKLNTLNKNKDSVLFPIISKYKLKKRFIEINSFLLGKEYDFFSCDSFYSAAIKIASIQLNFRIGFESDSFGKYGNQELQMLVHTVEKIENNAYHFLRDNLGFDIKEDLTPFNGNKNALIKARAFVGGLIWTQTNVGHSVHEEARKKSLNIQSEISESAFARRLFINSLHSFKNIKINDFNFNNFEYELDIDKVINNEKLIDFHIKSESLSDAVSHSFSDYNIHLFQQISKYEFNFYNEKNKKTVVLFSDKIIKNIV